MTDIEKKALELANDVFRERGHGEWINCTRRYEALTEAICRAIEQHEAFKLEVSDAAVEYDAHGSPMGWTGFERFILPKPDHVQDALEEVFAGDSLHIYCAKELRAALASRGLQIVEVGHD